MVWSVTASSFPTATRALAFCQSLEAPPPHNSSNKAFFATRRPYLGWTTRSGVRTDAPAAVPDGVEGDDDANPAGTSACAQLDLLEQLASNDSTSGYASGGTTRSLTIREQLSKLVGGRGGEFTLPLREGLKESVMPLTISQKRNIKRQAYLNEVSGRNDSRFFATIAAFVILPPMAILVFAALTGYVDLLP